MDWLDLTRKAKSHIIGAQESKLHNLAHPTYREA
jgi:hypothetical protein